MLIKRLRGGSAWQGQAGKVTFFGIVMVVVLVIAAGIMFMLLSEVLKTEEVTATIQVKNDTGFPLVGAAIFLDGQRVASSDSNGIYAYVYSVDAQGQNRRIKAEMADFDPSETVLNLTGKPATLTLTLQRSYAVLTLLVIDSLTNLPLSGVNVFLGNDRIDTTDALGKVVLPQHRMRLQDTPVIKLEKKKYLSRLEYPYIGAREMNLSVMLVKSEMAPPPEPPKKKTFPMAFNIIEPAPAKTRVPKVVETTPARDTIDIIGTTPTHTSLSTEALPHDTVAKADEALALMSDGQFRQALNTYIDLVGQRQWQARADFWLYGADCALHMASDANAVYNESIIDSALTFLDEAERYQNKIREDLFPAVVHMKKGEAWAYKMELPSAKNSARLQEYRQKARYYLMSAINMMKNKGLENTDIFRLAAEIRDEVDNR